MPGEWDEALRLLRPSMDAADQAAQAAQTREAWLRDVVLPRSNQYGHDINRAVSYFLETVQRYRPDIPAGLIASQSRESFTTTRGTTYARCYFTNEVRWEFLIDHREWPNKPHEGGSFYVQTDGRWYFGYLDAAHNHLRTDKEVTLFG